MKQMSLREFRKLGFVQEINRRLLHPCGLELQVSDDEVEVLDGRDEPEGLTYEPAELSRAKAQEVVDLFNAKLKHRREAFGHIIQPVPDNHA